MTPPANLAQNIDDIVREDWGRILASLVKNLGDIQLAEDCLQEAVISAMGHWVKNGVPRSPAAWLITTARRKAIDAIRRDKNFTSKQRMLSYLIDLENEITPEADIDSIGDKRLEMIFTCCHPALEEKSRIALTLRTIGGLTTEEIASAFLDKPEAMAQRLVRAKKKIALAGIPYEIPDKRVLPERVRSVLQVIYLIFNEGYSASRGDNLTRAPLSDEAVRLARIICHLMPAETEAAGLLALMLLHDSRRNARTDEGGEMISLEMQNRARWDQSKITQGDEILKEVLPKSRLGPYQLQAAISGVHAQSKTWEETDWLQISQLYALLYTIQSTPIIRINHAIAHSYAASPQEALNMLNSIKVDSTIERYQPYHAVRANLLARTGDKTAAQLCLIRALELTENLREKTFLQTKLDKLFDG